MDLCTAAEEKQTCFCLHAGAMIDVSEGELGKKEHSSLMFLVQRDRLKVADGRVAMAMTPEHQASSSSGAVKCEIGLPEGFSPLPEDFESSPLFVAFSLFISLFFFLFMFHRSVLFTASRFEKCSELRRRAAHSEGGYKTSNW